MAQEIDATSLVNRLGGRKFLLATFSIASTSLLVYLGHISDGVYSAVVIATVGSYIGGNVAQKITANPSSRFVVSSPVISLSHTKTKCIAFIAQNWSEISQRASATNV
jgi:hypothetical protein